MALLEILIFGHSVIPDICNRITATDQKTGSHFKMSRVLLVEEYVGCLDQGMKIFSGWQKV